MAGVSENRRTSRWWNLQDPFTRAAIDLSIPANAKAAPSGLVADDGLPGSRPCKNSATFCKRSRRARFFAIFSTLNALRPRRTKQARVKTRGSFYTGAPGDRQGVGGARSHGRLDSDRRARQSEVAKPPTLETTMQVAADRTDASTAIQTDLPAIFASLELSRSRRGAPPRRTTLPSPAGADHLARRAPRSPWPPEGSGEAPRAGDGRPVECQNLHTIFCHA